jgi:hypothetical protein
VDEATISNVAHDYTYAGRPKEAITLLEQVRDARVKQLGPDHPDTLASQHDLARWRKELDAAKTAIPFDTPKN